MGEVVRRLRQARAAQRRELSRLYQANIQLREQLRQRGTPAVRRRDDPPSTGRTKRVVNGSLSLAEFRRWWISYCMEHLA